MDASTLRDLHSRIEHLADNIRHHAVLSAEEVAALGAVSDLPRAYPGGMVERQGAGRRPVPRAASKT